MKKMLFALVNNEPEVLMRITALLRRIGFTTKSISMVEASNPSLAHLTIMTEENQNFEQAINQMEKFMDVHAVEKIDNVPVVEREWEAVVGKALELNLYELLNGMEKLEIDFSNHMTTKEQPMRSIS